MGHGAFAWLLAASAGMAAGPWAGTLGCGGTNTATQAPSSQEAKAAPTPALMPPGNAPEFRFYAIDGREVSNEVALGRNTVLAFLAAFDWASQAQARFLSGIERNHRPRTNCYAIVLERPEHDILVEAFVEGLSLRYPVAHVPTEKIAKTSFKNVRTVPSVIVLDPGGNLVWKSRGLATEETLGAVLRAVEKTRQGRAPFAGGAGQPKQTCVHP